jgi:transposase
VNCYQREGRAGVKKGGRAGRKPLMSFAEKRQLAKLLLKGPEPLGYETPLWTCPWVAHLIEQEFGVRYHPGHVWKLLIALGWSPQPPTGRARERRRAKSCAGSARCGRPLKKGHAEGRRVG